MGTTTTICIRVYSVPSSNALWHIDGLHCLIRWNLIIHGGIYGFSRRIMYFHASTNNRATVLKLFLEATGKYGWPSRVRSDLGGENVEVAKLHIEARGVGRHSHCWCQYTQLKNRAALEGYISLCMSHILLFVL